MDYRKRWLEGNFTKEEAQAGGRLREYEALERLEHALKGFRPQDFNEESEYARLLAKKQGLEPKKEAKVVSLFTGRTLLKIAASLALMAGSYFLFFNDAVTTVTTAAGQQATVSLPDGSSVILNADSKLTYNRRRRSGNRQVELAGEGFFKVVKDKGQGFSVVTAAGTVRVLGTEFNVKNRPGFFEVNCYEGRVRFEGPERVKELAAGSIFRMVSGQTAPVPDGVSSRTKPEWTEGESAFESVPFIQVVKEFERQYNVSVRLEKTDSLQLYTGTFTHANKDLALKSIALPLNLRVQVRGGQILLTGEPE